MTQSHLHPSAEEFLESLGLPSHHPYIDNDKEQSQVKGFLETHAHAEGTSSFIDQIIPAGSLVVDTPPLLTSERVSTGDGLYLPNDAACRSSQNNNFCDTPFPNESKYSTNSFERRIDIQSLIRSIAVVVTGFVQEVVPGMVASSHLFFRLFCPAILILTLLGLMLKPISIKTKSKRNKRLYLILHIFLCFTAMLCALVILTDAMYVLEFGRMPLVGLYIATSLLVYTRSPSWRLVSTVVLPMTGIAVWMVLHCELGLPTYPLEAGIFYDSTNPVVNAIVTLWPAENRQYTPSPWVINGDTRTGIPYFLNRIPYQHYERRWVPSNVPGEKEAVILDIAFPLDGIHRKDKPLYLVLCGLSGGSQEGYVKDFVSRRRADGSTVAVMVARGLMDSPVLGDNLLHFARVSDIDAAAKALKRAAAPQQTVAGVGYSMGALCLANYAARSGKDSHLDAVVGISGGLDTRQQIYNYRSERFWQPLIVKNLRDIIMRKFAAKLKKRMTLEQVKAVATARSLLLFDTRFAVWYHGFADIEDYYSEMGAMGDLVRLDGTPNEVGRIANVSIPLLMLHSIDDPVGTPKTFHDPKLVVKAGKGNVMLLITQKGGHVGWPIGMNPASKAWFWMSNVASSFVETADRVFHKLGKDDDELTNTNSHKNPANAIRNLFNKGNR